MPAAISSRIPLLAAALALLVVGLLLAAPPVAAQSLSNNANLSSLSLLGTDVAGFSGSTISYTVNLDAPEGPATVAAVAADTGASIAYGGTDADSDTDGHQVALNEGRNTVSVTVTAENGSTRKTYTVTVNVADALDGVGTTALVAVDTGQNGASSVQYWGSVRSAGEADWIRIRLEAGQMYRFALKGSYQSDSRTLEKPVISGLYDANGVAIGGTTEVGTVCDHQSGECNARMHYLASASGDYYLRARGYGNPIGT